MRGLYDAIELIAEASGTNDKKALLEKLWSKNLERVFSLALGQDTSFHLTDLPQTQLTGVTNPDRIFEMLEDLNEQGSATHADAQQLANAVGQDECRRELVKRILRKDLRCGVKAKTVNSVKPGTCFLIAYQRYSSFDAIDKIDFENDKVLGQIKLDGIFGYFNYKKEKFITRNGSQFVLKNVFSEFDLDWVKFLRGDVDAYPVLMGELLVLAEDNKTYLNRQTGNGYFNSFISGKGDSNIIPRVRYVTWGFITETEFLSGKSERTYEETIVLMENALARCGSGSKIIITPSTPINSLEEAMAFYRTERSRKEEGAMIKVANKLKWKSESSGSKFGVKLKPSVQAEFEIIEGYYGDKNKKWANHLGGLLVKTSDGKILTRLGGGFTDQQRLLGVDWWNKQKGKIVTGEFTGIITDKTSRETWALDHGRFVETRFNEKNEADTYDYCVKIIDSCANRL